MKNLGRFGENAPRWAGGTTTNGKGRILVFNPKHNKAYKSGYVLRYIAIAERVLGKPLPKGAVVHHIDGDVGNDEHNNLVVCENDAFHQLLHRRERAYRACGQPTWRTCKYCKKYDAPENLQINPSDVRHRKCHIEYCKAYYDSKTKAKDNTP